MASLGREWGRGSEDQSFCLFLREQQEKLGPWGREVTRAPQAPRESRD